MEVQFSIGTVKSSAQQKAKFILVLRAVALLDASIQTVSDLVTRRRTDGSCLPRTQRAAFMNMRNPKPQTDKASKLPAKKRARVGYEAVSEENDMKKLATDASRMHID